MRKLSVLVVLAGLMAALVSTAFAATTSVKVGDNYFVRATGVPTVTVHRGATVRWVFRGKAPHNVAVKTGPVRFYSGSKRSGSYSKRLTRRGTYVIYCTIHGARDQRMKLIVR